MSGLAFVNYTLLESSPLRDMLMYRFTSSHAGYGNRSGMVTAQAITEHTRSGSRLLTGTWNQQ